MDGRTNEWINERTNERMNGNLYKSDKYCNISIIIKNPLFLYDSDYTMSMMNPYHIVMMPCVRASCSTVGTLEEIPSSKQICDHVLIAAVQLYPGLGYPASLHSVISHVK